MNIQSILDGLENCPCGRAHRMEPMTVEIGPGLLARTAEILSAGGFPRRLLVVADENTLGASRGILEILAAGGFQTTLKLYEDLRTADMGEADALTGLCENADGVLSVGTGSLNDICRLAAFRTGRAFAIFATAPSMDGFASSAAPITENGFKKTIPCRAPSMVIGDTGILAKAPAELKSAGFGDMLGKYVSLADWKIARLSVGEHYCPRVAALMKNALERVVSMAGRVAGDDPETAGALMEALVLSGLAMTLADSTRPAAGGEHMLAHFWEIKNLERGAPPDFHGREVGVATLLVTEMYHQLAGRETVAFHADATDWGGVYAAFGPHFEAQVRALNSPTVTDETSAETLRERWPEIRRIVREELPAPGQMLALLRAAGAATAPEEIGVPPELAGAGLRFHPYMRHRMTLSRLRSMMADGA